MKPRKLKAKPEALAARGKLADGTAPGTERSPFAGIDRSIAPESLQHVKPSRPLSQDLILEGGAIMARREGMDSAPFELARLEIRTAERDRALDLLEQLERVLTKIGGFMTPADQDTLRAARALLVELGRREPENRAMWQDRV